MSIDKFLSKKYNKKTYNCAHLVAEVWEEETGHDITEILEGFLLPPKERFVRANLRRKFKKLKTPESPCIVLMQHIGGEPHVGIYIRGKVLQIAKNGVNFLTTHTATLNYSRVGFYTC